METTTRFTVDAVFCQRASDELCEILRGQGQALVTRYNRWLKRGPTVMLVRILGTLVSLLGLTLVSLLRHYDTRAWSTQPPLWFIPIFVACIAGFIFQPRLAAFVEAWSLRRADRGARRFADRGFRVARRLAPYDAHYDLKGELLTSTRHKDGEWRHAWLCKLGKFRARGVAIQAENITAIFRRPSSLFPSVLILHHDGDWTERVLRENRVTVIRMHARIGTPASPMT